MTKLFFSNDIVEILNLSPIQVESMRYYAGNSMKDVAKDVVGMRYKIEVEERLIYRRYPYPLNVQIAMKDWQYGYTSRFFHPSQIALIHRPFKNYIKAALSKLFSYV